MAADEGPNAADIGIVLRDMARGADDWLARGARILGLKGTEELSGWLAGAPPPEGLHNELAALWAMMRVNDAEKEHARRRGRGEYSPPTVDRTMPAGLSPAMDRRMNAWWDHMVGGVSVD
jgi:hypothetical protein